MPSSRMEVHETGEESVMSTTDFIIKVRDAAAMVLDSCTEYLEKHAAPPGESASTAATWNPEKIVWTSKIGAKGTFQMSEDMNNLDFKAMHKDLVDHQGNLNRDGMFYWIFPNGATVGRKQK